jgi:hypothetical protein
LTAAGEDLKHQDESISFEEQGDLIWGKKRSNQNVFYLHGALQFFDAGVAVIKEEYDQHNFLLEKINDRMAKGEYPIFVTDGNGKQKLKHILHNQYLTYCYESLCSISGSLVNFGFNFGSSDEHIIDAINKAAKHGQKVTEKLWSIYIGVYSEEDIKHINQIAKKFKCKVRIFDAKTVCCW